MLCGPHGRGASPTAAVGDGMAGDDHLPRTGGVSQGKPRLVYHHPKDRMLNTARGTYTITGLMPGLEQPQYRIKHFSED